MNPSRPFIDRPVASSVASPLERHLGTIADVTEMTSQSSVGVDRLRLGLGAAGGRSRISAQR
ncbi:MAG: hypothetical protein OSB38_40975 [Paraburkholderia fungorum]|nr:hypothetical protein [Paraburkholderia fungorum]